MKVFFCGPIAVTLNAEKSVLMDMAAGPLAQYDVSWEKPHLPVRVDLEEAHEPAIMVEGNYLKCARMNVDETPVSMYATCRSGCSCSYSLEEDRWVIAVPSGAVQEWEIFSDLDDLMGLILTTSWRRTGWIPVHAGAVAKESSCTIVCAPAGAGKSTLVTAMICRGWETLGDDKLLLRIGENSRVQLAALVHTLHLDSKTERWVPQAKNLNSFPGHSPNAKKRRVQIDRFWPGKAVRKGTPTHLVQVILREDLRGVHVDPMKENDVLSALLHQTVIPKNTVTAKQILSTIAYAASKLKGLKVTIGQDAYDDYECLSPLEGALG